MYPNQVPIKTPKGLQEVGSRTYKLPSAMRRILIMVNGHSTVAELSENLMRFGEIESILMHLEAEGFIAPNPASSPLPETSRRPIPETSRRPTDISQQPTVASSPLGPQPKFNLEKAKGFIRFVLLGAMGPTAERRINRIEATTTPEELRVELDAIHDMLHEVLSKKEAQQAWRQLAPIMVSLHMPSP